MSIDDTAQFLSATSYRWHANDERWEYDHHGVWFVSNTLADSNHEEGTAIIAACPWAHEVEEETNANG